MGTAYWGRFVVERGLISKGARTRCRSAWEPEGV